MKIFNRQTGTLGENLATSYLEKQGYRLITRNFHNRFGEIDLIALTPDKQTIVFIEVKTKTSNHFGSPEDMITQHKLQQVYRTSQIYLQSNTRYKNMSPRIDIITITLTPEKNLNSLKHYPAVY
jgi:putative endonuclease